VGDDHFSLVTAQLGAGKVAGEVKVPSDASPRVQDLTFSIPFQVAFPLFAVDELNKTTPPASSTAERRPSSCARGRGRGGRQTKVNELFPNLSRGNFLPTDLEEDLASWRPASWDFGSLHPQQPETENEWEDQVNCMWDELVQLEQRETVSLLQTVSIETAACGRAGVTV
jgi:hypothetical protein